MRLIDLDAEKPYFFDCRYYVGTRKDLTPKRGEWIHDTLTAANTDNSLYSFEVPACKCSVCGLHSEHETWFCPFCGADMRGKHDE